MSKEARFRPVDTHVAFPDLEVRILDLWKKKDIFAKSVRARIDGPLFSFYEGPPTANGSPGIHHVLARVFKDVVLRYRTMRGYHVPRVGGWDTHGLPVELEVEKALGFSGKREIEAYGIAKFNKQCKESVFRYVKDWERLTDRIGFWVDTENAYVTYHTDYIESCWWIIKELWERDLMVQDYRVTPHCPRCNTSLSSHEVALGYKENTDDPSVYVRLPLLEDQPSLPRELGLGKGVPVSFLIWTTTPWTLPGNVAVALAQEASYAVVELDAGNGLERLILADALREAALQQDHEVVATVTGADLVGARYEPLYKAVDLDKPAYRAVVDPFVSLKEGTGIVHIAPAFGETDLELGRREDLPILITVDLEGIVQDSLPGAGMFVKKADPVITADLEERNLPFRSERIRHTYPFCWRCDTPLLYYAKTSWYLRTTAKRDQLLAGNESINWYPGHIKAGRFGDWLENNVDWAVSRERYWGTPLPIWKCEACGQFDCLGSVDDLRRRTNQDNSLELISPNGELDLHRPYVDDVTLHCHACKGTMRRVPEVLDAWFDSGAMPYANQHYPFEHKPDFERNFPADYICEAIDQTRGWFYSLHALSTLLFDGVSYRNVICLGLILDAKGEKMSKRMGNIVDPWSVLDLHGADAVRWYLYSATPAGQNRRFSSDLVGETVRKFLLTLWNTYSFFVMYANIDGWRPQPSIDRQGADDREKPAPLDQWIIGELNQLILDVTEAMESYDPTTSTRKIQQFVDVLSNWYVRRSRRRFWKSEDDGDKNAAYDTLYACLVTIARLLAPFAPFIAEELHQNLVRQVDPDGAESVHCSDWPVANEALIDEPIMAANQLVLRLVGMGRAARSKANLKVRQPLAVVKVKTRDSTENADIQHLADLIKDELNVRRIEIVEDEAELVSYSLKPNLKLLGPKYGKQLAAVGEQLAKADATSVVNHFRTQMTIALDGFEIQRDEILVETSDGPQLSSIVEAGYVVAVSTELTPELVQEGQVREVVHRIQGLRRTAGLDVADRIKLWIDAPKTLRAALEGRSGYVSQEALAPDIEWAEGPKQSQRERFQVDGESVGIALEKR